MIIYRDLPHRILPVSKSFSAAIYLTGSVSGVLFWFHLLVSINQVLSLAVSLIGIGFHWKLFRFSASNPVDLFVSLWLSPQKFHFLLFLNCKIWRLNGLISRPIVQFESKSSILWGYHLDVNNLSMSRKASKKFGFENLSSIKYWKQKIGTTNDLRICLHRVDNVSATEDLRSSTSSLLLLGLKKWRSEWSWWFSLKAAVER